MNVGFAAQMRNGKTIGCNYLCSKMGANKTSFATPVKKIFCNTFGVSPEFVEKWKTSTEVPPGFSMTVRQSLQQIGDGFRNIKSDVWINLSSNDKNNFRDDIRYRNEMEFIHRCDGINVLLWRPGFENNDPSESEAQIKVLVDYYVNSNLEGVVQGSGKDGPEGVELVDVFLINNGTIQDFYAKIDKFVVPLVKG